MESPLKLPLSLALRQLFLLRDESGNVSVAGHLDVEWIKIVMPQHSG